MVLLSNKEVRETTMERSATLSENEYYEELKPLIDVAKNTVTNVKVTEKFYNMIVPIVSRARKVIARNH